PPKIVITSMNVFDRPLRHLRSVSQQEIRERVSGMKSINLAPHEHSFSIEFAALHYVNPDKNRYAYMLEGYDHDWTFSDSEKRFANYSNLNPGDYIFHLKASNSDGLWAETDVTLRITVAPPFYVTAWFITLATAVLILSGVFAYRKRIETIKKHQSMKALQLESELNFLKMQVNPHFLFNTLNNIYALCQVNSENAAPMVRKVSEMMRYMIYDCKAQRVALQKEIEYLQNYVDLNQLKSARKLNVSISVEGNTEGVTIAPLLLINFLENSFKHGNIYFDPAGFIHGFLRLSEKGLVVVIRNSFTDNGVKQQDSEGIGLENVRHRLKLLYPGKHLLKIGKNSGIFEIELKLELD
ncbi:MAG TPA: histidine kinase, partial [Chryseosolibacter sp.]|nr:histidine kinase [Chryseosolibacter sp.]